MTQFRFTARDGTKVLFREPRSTDAKQLMDFINGFVEEPRSGLLINKKVKLKDEKAWLKGWIADIRRREGLLLLVEVDGKIKGSCSVLQLKWKSSHVADLGIALSRDIRGKGIGEALMNKAITLAGKRMKGLEIIQLKTFSYNERALEFYRRLGFVEVGRVPRVNKEGRNYYDDVLMTRSLH